LGSDLSQNLHRFRNRSGHMSNERRWLHAANRLLSGAKYLYANVKLRTRIVKRPLSRIVTMAA
jgi:hypothetical protein